MREKKTAEIRPCDCKAEKGLQDGFKGRSFLKLEDYTPAEIEYLVDLAGELKAKKKAGIVWKGSQNEC